MHTPRNTSSVPYDPHIYNRLFPVLVPGHRRRRRQHWQQRDNTRKLPPRHIRTGTNIFTMAMALGQRLQWLTHLITSRSITAVLRGTRYRAGTTPRRE